METNNNTNRKKEIALVLLAVLAIGGGSWYLNGRRNLNNEVATSATTVAAITATSVTAVPVPEAMPVENSVAETTMVAATQKVVRQKRVKSKKVVQDEQISVATVDAFGGNMPQAGAPVVPQAAVAQAEAPEVVMVQTIKKSEVAATSAARKYGRVNIGPEVGGNLNSLYNNTTANQNTNGFHAGVIVNIELNDKLALQSGVRYITKGNEENVTSTSAGMEVKTTNKVGLGYLEVPANIVFKFGDVKGQPRFMVGAGPYVAYLANAKVTQSSASVNAEGFTVSTTRTATATAGNMHRFDAGVSGFLGCQMPKGFYAKAGAGVGLMNVQGNADRNFNVLLSVGQIIGRKGKTY